jgi:hypothetical protein
VTPGWRQRLGRLTLTGSAKRVGAAWTDDGAAVDQRQLKHRARDAARVVPIPPLLVAILHDHIERFGTAADGRLFQVTWGQRGKGGLLTTKVYGPVWQKARAAALTRAQQASPSPGAPTTCGTAASPSPNAGVPAPEVANRAGHSVEVLWRVYVGCAYGQEKLWNRRIEEALDLAEEAQTGPEDGPGNLADSVPSLFRKHPSNAGNSRELPGAYKISPRPHRRWSEAVSAGGGRCWVRTNVGFADGFTSLTIGMAADLRFLLSHPRETRVLSVWRP